LGREKAGLSVVAAAEALDMSRQTLTRIEKGDSSRLRRQDIEAAAQVYGLDDDQTNDLAVLADQARKDKNTGWWQNRTRTELAGFFVSYAMLEDAAQLIRQFEIMLVPGLLQTRAYAEQMHLVPAGYLTPEVIKKRVDARIERQTLLTRGHAPRLEVILDEAVLRRVVGGEEMMEEQLEHLVMASQWPNVSIRIVSFEEGVHGGMAASTPFTLLSFPENSRGEPSELPIAYVDALTGALYQNEPEHVAAFNLVWKDLEAVARSEEKTREMIRERIEELISNRTKGHSSA
jgi:transcriptional regulator with XRE-family HTH domain